MRVRSRRAYVVRDATSWFAFVPSRAGGYLKTDWCVALVACECCSAKVGDPCHGRNGETASTHYVRRRAGKKVNREWLLRALPAASFAMEEL